MDELMAQKRFLAATVALAFMVSLSTLLLSRAPSAPHPQVSVGFYLDFDSITHPPANLFDHS